MRRIPTGFPTESATVSLRLQLREKNHVADAFLAEEHHAEAVVHSVASGFRGPAPIVASIRFLRASSSKSSLSSVQRIKLYCRLSK